MHCVVSIPKHSKMIVNKSMLTFQITSRLQFDFFCLVLKQITIKNALFCKTSLFNQGYYIEVISKTFSSHLTLTRFLIFLQPLKIVVWVFFLLDQKVGLTARNHATYPKLQSNISLKLFVLESIIKNQNKYLGA